MDVSEAEIGRAGMGDVSGYAPNVRDPLEQAGVDAHTRSAQMGNTVDVNENEYAVATFEQKLAAVRKLESVVIQ